jgi:methionine-rich copper-binding protein CopC
MKRRRTLAALAIACVAGLAHGPAHAHALFAHSEPRVGATVQAAPAELKLWFTEQIEPAFSTVEVLDAAGKRVDKGDAHVDAQDRRLLRVSLGTLAAGSYTVVWRVVSEDSHATRGDFTFRVEH